MLFLLFTLIVGVPLGEVHADDSVAMVVPTGIQFERSKDISMEFEELEISEELVRVKFEFKNESDHDITTTVAFPVPPVQSDVPAIQFTDQKGKLLPNPLKFTLRIDGKEQPVQLKTEDTGGWIALRYYWSQTFPRGKVVKVEHSYLSGAGSPSLNSFKESKATLEGDFCADAPFVKAVRTLFERAIKKDDSFITLDSYMIWSASRRVRYVLKTGANWKGPIKKFRLILKKRDPNTLLSLCWNGLKKTGPTTFLSEVANFNPTKDLDILFVHSFSR